MKKQVFKVRILNFKAFAALFVLGVLFSVMGPNITSAQTVVKGTIFVYNSETNEADTTGLLGTHPIIKFYKMGSSGNLVYVKSAEVAMDGTFSTTVSTSASDLYAVIFKNDEDDNYVTSYYPGYMDFESAETISISSGDTVDGDWGAVGKEIVERPSTGNMNVNGTISLDGTLSDFPLSVSAFVGGMPIASTTVKADGSYTLNVASGEYEIFVSAPGYASQSKFVNESGNAKNINLNFELDKLKSENEGISSLAPNSYLVSQNYPNPFNPTTNIKYSIPAGGLVKITIYNMVGKEVENLINRYQDAGSYSVEFNGSDLASGIYIYRVSAGDFSITKKMNLIK